MKRSPLIVLTVLVVLLAVFSLTGLADASRNADPAAPSAGAPTIVAYQGQVTVSGVAYTGAGYFKFAVVDATPTTYWSNDGTSTGGGAPTAAVQLDVNEGLFSVLLGDSSLTNMAALPATAFSGTERYLRVWFSSDGMTFTLLTPDRRIAAVPYALQAEESKTAATAGDADTLDALHASAFQQHYQGVKVVAKSGGDYTTVTAALASITDASDTNRYLVKVAPGIYSEQVTMKPFVDIEGSGELTTKLTFTGTPTGSGTVMGANNAELRFLSVENTGGTTAATAIYNNASPRLTHITVSASGGSVTNRGVENLSAAPVMTNVTISAVGGSASYGILNNSGSAPTLTNVSASASGSAGGNYGLYNSSSSATIQGSVISAGGASGNRIGIMNSAPSSGYTVLVTNSRVSGAANSIYLDSHFTLNVGATQLSGPVAVNGGIVTYAGSYDGSFTLNGNQTFSGIPAFNGGASGSSAPFTVDSNYLVSGLNADLLDGQHASNASGGIPLNNGTLNTNLNADLLDGQHASAFQQHYANVVFVAKSGGDYTTITAALNSITASDANRYLVKVLPGAYSERVTMKQYVDIEGAGELTTKITYTGSATQDTGTVVGADNAELRFLSVENTGGNTVAIAIYNNPASPRLTDVTASASGGSNANFGVYNWSASPVMIDVTASGLGGNYAYGVYNQYASPAMRNVSATGSGGSVDNSGVLNNWSSPVMVNVTASASGGSRDNDGVYNYNSTPTIRNSIISASGATGNRYGLYNTVIGSTYTLQVHGSQISGDTNSIYSTTTSGAMIVLVGASQLSGGPVSGGTPTCAGVYDEAYLFSASTCP